MTIKTNIKAGYRADQHNQTSGLKLSTGVKASGLSWNHNQSGVLVKSSLKAGLRNMQHNQTSGLKLSTGVKAGGLSWNHSQSGVAVKSTLEAGISDMQHNQIRATAPKVCTVYGAGAQHSENALAICV